VVILFLVSLENILLQKEVLHVHFNPSKLTHVHWHFDGSGHHHFDDDALSNCVSLLQLQCLIKVAFGVEFLCC